MSWFLYMIECVDGTLYTGIAVDVEARFALHLAGKGAKYTRAHPPLRVVFRRRFKDRSLASKAEYAMKQLSREEKWGVCKARRRARPRRGS